jgi:aminopeptidase N
VGLKQNFVQVYRANQTNDEYSASADQVARRALKNTALAYLMLDADEGILALCDKQFTEADNMTDVFSALTALVNCSHKQAAGLKQAALETFYQTWKDESLVVNQWFQVQASCQLPGNLAVVKSLMKHPAFDFKNPNKLRALVGAFCGTNAINFHQLDGEGYEFLADQIIVLNESNPQIASRLLTPLTRWKKYPQQRRELMRAQLERIKSEPSLSKDVFEVLAKTLG